MQLGFEFEVDNLGCIKWPIKAVGKVADLYCWSRVLNTNLLYYILCFTLCSTNYNLLCIYFFSILNFGYFIRKIKQTYNKL